MSTADLAAAARPNSMRTAVEIIDSDVHPTPHPDDDFAQYIPAAWRDRLIPRGHEVPYVEQRAYDQADFFSCPNGRYDSRPPGGGEPCSDPTFAFQQLMVDAGIDMVLLQPMGGDHRNIEEESVIKASQNEWLADVWLERNNHHGRWRGSISVSNRDPEGAAREIDRWASHPMMVSVLMSPQTRGVPFGDPRLDPIYAAATRHGLPVVTHLMSIAPYDNTPLLPVGNPTHFLDFFGSYPLLFMSHIMSLIFDGVFERFPTLQVVFSEGACTWILPAMWRMDAVWRARRTYLPLVRRPPSEYVREHIWFTTQPLEDAPLTEYRRYMSWLDPSDLLLYSSDYPHWSYDDPSWASNRFPKASRAAVMRDNARRVFGFPDTVAALPDLVSGRY